VHRQIRETDKTLLEGTPPEVVGQDLDALVAQAKQLEEFIREGMLSAEEMRHAPDGSVNRHQAWESANARSVGCKTRLHAIQRWKNTLLIINRGNTDPDIVNVERLRPRASYASMASAIVPTKAFSFPSEQFTENFPQDMQAAYPRLQEENLRLREQAAQRSAPRARKTKARRPAKSAAQAAAPAA